MTWTTHEAETAAKMWADGYSAASIGAAIGQPKNTVISYANRHRDKFPAKQTGRERKPLEIDLEEAAAMWKAGETSVVIAARFKVKVGRISTIVAQHRDMFPFRGAGIHAAKPQRRMMKRKAVTSVWQRADPFAPKVKLYIPPELDQYEIGRLPGVSMLDNVGCKWPLSDNKPHLFCGADANGSWCAHHAVKLKGQGTISERQATKVKGSW